MASKTSKQPTSTRVRAVPDFSKLHNKWQEKLQTGKACAKKPCTVVHEFDLTQGGAKVEHVRTRSMSGKRFNEKNHEDFTTDKRALRSIINNEGVADGKLTGRATVAGANHLMKKQSDVRQSEYSSRSRHRQARESTAAKTKLPTKSIKRKATSPLNVQKEDIQFETDQTALDSILQNQGVSVKDLTSHYCPTNQKPGKEFKTPNGPAMKREGVTEGRPSTYQRIPVDRTAIFTDYKSRVLSRLTLGGSKSPSVVAKSPGTELKKDQYRVFEPIRNSMYVRVCGTSAVSTVNADQLPGSMRRATMQKASRVLVTTPSKSPAFQQLRPSSLKVKKWKDVLREVKDPVKKTLMYDNENEAPNENNNELENIEKRERHLLEQISKLEHSKQEHKRQRKDSQSANRIEPSVQEPSEMSSQSVLPSTEYSQKQIEIIEKDEQALQAEINVMEKRKQERLKRSPESENPLPSSQDQARNPFQQLSKTEIAKRSLNLAAGSDSESEDNCGSSGSDGCVKYPQSPLAKDQACKVIKPNTVSHGAASKVRQTALEGNAGKSRGRSRSTKESVLATRSPRCRDLWSPNRGRVEKSPRRVSKMRTSHTPPRSPKASWSKEGPGSPLFSHVMSKVGEQIKRAPLSSVVTNHVKSVELGLDKENMAPAFLREDPSPKIYRYTTDDDPMMKDVFNESVDKLNQSIADITYQFEELENEALTLGEKSFQENNETVDRNDLLAQLAAIKAKQEELVRNERRLQKQLFRQKYGSPKMKDDDGTPKSAKKRLQMFRDDKEMGDQKSPVRLEDQLQKSPERLEDQLQKSPISSRLDSSIPEITEKASRLELSSEQPDTHNIFTGGTAIASDKCMDEEPTAESDEAVYENIFPTPPLPPRSKVHRVISPEALRPKLPTPKILPSNTTFSPKPRMAGSSQLFRCISPLVDAPIQTPLVLRTAALAAKQISDNGFRAPGVATVSLHLQNSPIDLSVKSANSSVQSANSSSSFSPDISFSYVDEKRAAEKALVKETDWVVPRVIPQEMAEPSDRTTTMISDVQTTPARSSTKFTNTMTTAMSSNAVTLSSDSDILSSQMSTLVSNPAPLVHNLVPTEHGSMSLFANITRTHPTPSRVGFQSCIVAATTQKYYDALMDDEVALFMDRLATKSPHQMATSGHGCSNPLAALLERGDDMHFVPICEETESPLLSVRGSAFASYVCI